VLFGYFANGKRRSCRVCAGESRNVSVVTKRLRHWTRRGLSLGCGAIVAGLLAACESPQVSLAPSSVNSRYTDAQPALSANGRFLAFVSNRNGSHDIFMYDLQERRFLQLSGLNRPDAIAESPSLTNTGRYLAYAIANRSRGAIVVYDRITQGSQVVYQADLGGIRRPKISPEGRYIVFESGRRGQWDIETLDRGPAIELDLLDGQTPGTSVSFP
jgi:Tol biopolymer transport system component